MTIACGDSHTSTHGAFGALAVGIGTSEVEHVLATQTLPQATPSTLAVTVDGALADGVTAKDIVLAIINRIGTGGGIGSVIEYRGSAIRALSMEGRMTVCNMSIEAGARAGLIAPDDTTFAYLEGREYKNTVLPHPYAFNLFSHNSKIDPANGYNEEEIKVMRETHKIFGDSSIRVAATCVRVPVLRAHSIAINFECERPITPAQVRDVMQTAPGVKIVDDVERNYFPMPKDASGQDPILVGRIRQDVSDPSGRSIALFVAGDQLLKGAALNAVQIAELLLK